MDRGSWFDRTNVTECTSAKKKQTFSVVCFLLGNSSASEFCMPTYRNTLLHLHRHVGMKNNN
jgi:hypothetical protein